MLAHWLTRTFAYSHVVVDAVRRVYCNALLVLLARWSFRQTKHVSSVQLRRSVRALTT